MGSVGLTPKSMLAISEHADVSEFATLLIDTQALPLFIHDSFDHRVHRDLLGPRTRKAFGGPLTSGVNAHLGTVVRQARGVIERIDGTKRELDVPLRVDVIQSL